MAAQQAMMSSEQKPSVKPTMATPGTKVASNKKLAASKPKRAPRGPLSSCPCSSHPPRNCPLLRFTQSLFLNDPVLLLAL